MKNIIAWIKGLFSKKKPIVLPPISSPPIATCDARIFDPIEFEKIERSVLKNKGKKKSLDQIHVIPISVHVIHKGEAIGTGTNISDAQIHSAINGLNKAYSKEAGSMYDGEGVATPFRFMLANKDDQGNPTTGIYRFNGAEASAEYALNGIRSSTIGETEFVVKNWSRQSNQRVHNIWVVSEIEGNGGGSGIQAYSYFPTTSYVDGIVNLFNAFGVRPKGYTDTFPNVFNLKSYTNQNKTVIHEFGHSEGLYHTFQGNSCTETNCEFQGDRVCDTPPTIQNSNGAYPACGGTQQVENYMDYTNQSYKNMFTLGQKDRMVSVHEFSRDELDRSDALDNLQTITATATIEIVSPRRIQCPNNSQLLEVKITNTSDNPIHKAEINYMVEFDNDTVVAGTVDYYGTISPEGSAGYDYVGLDKFDLDRSCTITVSITSINDNPANVVETKNIIIPTNAPYKVVQKMDIIAAQISWTVTDAITGELIYENPTQKNFMGGTMSYQNMCLPDGHYIFTLKDSDPGFNTPGAYVMFLDGAGNILVNANTAFGTIYHEFWVGNKSPDINQDGVVNIFDISIVSAAFGTQIGDTNYNPDADLNNDGAINLFDISIIAAAFSQEQSNKP